MDDKEYFKQFAQTDDLWVVHQTHHLVVARIAFAHLRIGGVEGVAIAIARLHVQHTLDTHKHGLGAPKAAATQGNYLSGWAVMGGVCDICHWA